MGTEVRTTPRSRREAPALLAEVRTGGAGETVPAAAPAVGVRESRHLEGRYRPDITDMQQARRFEDAVTSVNFGVDVHEIDPDSEQPNITLPPGTTPDQVDGAELHAEPVKRGTVFLENLADHGH